MGNKLPKLNEEQVRDLQQNLFLTEQEILKAYDIWEDIGGDLEKEIYSNELSKVLPGLNGNPWTGRLTRVFSSRKDPESGLNVFYFSDFLTLISALHFRTPEYIKLYWLFTLFDSDGDDRLNDHDVRRILKTTCGDEMPPSEIVRLSNRIFKECDMDGDRMLSRSEFSRICRKFNIVERTFVMNLLLQPITDQNCLSCF